MTTRKKIWISCIGLALLLFCVGVPTTVAWRARWTLAENLADAQSVTLEQFTIIGSKVVASRDILPADFAKLLHAFPYTFDYGAVVFQKMCFVPHHQVVIKTRNGETFVCRICFTCDMYSTPAVGVNDMPVGWSHGLRKLFWNAGISPDAPKEVMGEFPP